MRRIWIATGLTLTVVFVVWNLIAYRATDEARAALATDGPVKVQARDTHWTFERTQRTFDTGLLFFAGALVDPVAYAPLARRIAEAGYPVVLVALPRRGAFGGADGAEVLNRGIGATTDLPQVARWVIAGHSRGGAVAARLALTRAPSFAGLILIGTSHPRDFSLAATLLPVTRIYGTRDTVADVEKLARTRANLPPDLHDVRIDGGNHSQFGYYGFQPGDWPATISRDEQQRITTEAILGVLQAVTNSR